MKTTIKILRLILGLILMTTLFTSCDKEEEVSCDCEKVTYRQTEFTANLYLEISREPYDLSCGDKVLEKYERVHSTTGNLNYFRVKVECK